MKLALNILKNGIGAFTGSLIGLNVLDASVTVWKQAAGAGIGAVIIAVYNWASLPGANPEVK